MNSPKYVFEAECDLLDDGPRPSQPLHHVRTVEAPTLNALLTELAACLQSIPHASVNSLHVARYTHAQWLERMRARTAVGQCPAEFEARQQRLCELWQRELDIA